MENDQTVGAVLIYTLYSTGTGIQYRYCMYTVEWKTSGHKMNKKEWKLVLNECT